MTQQWLDGLVGACVGVFVGALALYGAVWLLTCIWPWLVGAAVIVTAVVGVLTWYRRY